MKRKHPELTELEILERLHLGLLVVDFENQVILSHVIGRGRRKAPLELTQRRGGRTTQYLYVRIKWNSKRRNISVHRLAWLAHTMQPIPSNHQIHHGAEGVEVWHPRNLHCLTEADHLALHRSSEEPIT